MNKEKGWYFAVGALLLLLLLWGGSYLYIRHTRIAVTAVFDCWKDEKGNEIFVDGEQLEILYNRQSVLQTALYYLHRPLHKIDSLVNRQGAPTPELR